MFALGLILPICFVAGYTGAAIPTQWGLLSIVLPLSLWRPVPMTSIHWLGVAFVAYAVALAPFGHNIYTPVIGVWYVLIWALSFRLGTAVSDLVPLWKGLSVGLSISSAVALAQTFGFDAIPSVSLYPAGLLVNSTLQGAALALVLTALLAHGLYRWMPVPILGLALSHSRGGWLILGAAALAHYTHWIIAALVLVIGALVLSLVPDHSDTLRLALWGEALRHLTVFGNGPDAFNDIFLFAQGGITHAEFVHNDYLQLVFEFGLAAMVPIGILAMALSRNDHPDWPVAFGFAVLASFYFPLYTPLLAFIGCVSTGHILRGVDPVRAFRDRRRQRVLLWNPVSQ